MMWRIMLAQMALKFAYEEIQKLIKKKEETKK
jgi:hypothetical protein